MVKSFACCCWLALAVPAFSATLLSGSNLEVRLSTPVGSHSSKPGDRVEALVIAPVESGHNHLLLQRSKVFGTVEQAESVGFGLKRSGAELRVRFDTLQLTDGARVPIQVRVTQIEASRERVSRDGTVLGIDPAANLSSGFTFLLSTFLVHTELEGPALAIKLLAARSPDSEIYLPKGSELFIQTTKDAVLPDTAAEKLIAPLSGGEKGGIEKLLSTVPGQTELAPHRASDLINMVLVGTRDDIQSAFRAAGWSGECKHSPLALYRMYHSLVQRMGYTNAPMSRLLFNGRIPSETYQKGLDTLAKRHHVRFWKQGDTNVWLGAASEDIGYTVRRMHLTHAVDPHIDNERAKVINDLWMTGCVEGAALVPHKPTLIQNRTAFTTDGDVAVLRIGRCDAPLDPVPARKRSARSKALLAMRALRNDIERANPVTVAVTFARSVHSAWDASQEPTQTLVARRPERCSVLDPVADQLAQTQH